MTEGHKPQTRYRATLSHEKEGRRQDILGAALGLFRNATYGDITMASIAAQAGMAKGTIYIYFNTKEEIFLELSEGMLLGWFEALDEGLRRGGGLFMDPIPPSELAGLLLASLEAQPSLARLLGILHTVLEHNVDRLVALRFKEFLADRCLRTGRLLEQRLPFLREGQGPELMLRIHALVLGLWQMSDPPPEVKALLQSPGLQLFDAPFRPQFEAAFLDLLAGMEARASRPA